VAHEIRNPLTVIKMLYHALRLDFPSTDPRARDAQIMGEQMDHLNRIVEQVLDFARTSDPQLAPVNLNSLIQEMGLLTRHKLTQQGIALEHRLEPDLPVVLADAAQLRQAFLNLILNAAEAMPQGGRLTIRTDAVGRTDGQPGPSHIRVQFQDTGQGLPADRAGRPLTGLLQTSKAKGTGLGLAIVARILESHRGEVVFRSRAGRGTSVAVLLPLQGEPEQKKTPSASAEGVGASQPVNP
jgi:signal transduction histidine kinase